ncbi:Protein N-terminal amidase [Grifola frondosa]|uniref:Protein N-terminal amidase n=1 Tax=Grifola frondosa TaxID=5627 RepID=A0A1C7M917_GRIFR|nr:Protein N-terminal amidase [Grifola frondosa]
MIDALLHNKIGCVKENIATAERLCEKPRLSPGDDIYWLRLPDAASISPYLEEPRVGPTSRFCADLAARLHCHVVAGYPERLVPHEREKAVSEDGVEVTKIGANSAVLYGPTGTFVDGYRKTNLFETDMTWAKAGVHRICHLHTLSSAQYSQYRYMHGPEPAASIIWDIDEGPYEVADYCIAKKTNLLILLNAWLDSGAEPEKNTDWQTLNYWAARLRPLWAKIAKEDPSNKHRYEEADEAEKIYSTTWGRVDRCDLQQMRRREWQAIRRLFRYLQLDSRAREDHYCSTLWGDERKA